MKTEQSLRVGFVAANDVCVQKQGGLHLPGLVLGREEDDGPGVCDRQKAVCPHDGGVDGDNFRLGSLYVKRRKE